MFDLSQAEMSGRVLDCSAGASSFVAEAARRGCRSVAVDPAYALPRTDLVAAARADLDRGNAIAADHPDRFTWDWYGRRQRRTELRLQALGRFTTDIVMSPGRYVAGQLPQLPFRDRSFDIAVCSHLLFTWADQLGRSWHGAALHDIARVAAEVRIFP